MRNRISPLFLSLAVGLICLSSSAQVAPPAVPASARINIRGVKMESEKTPDYAISARGTVKRDGRADWLKLSCEYDILPPWTDEITFTYYVVLNGTPANLGPDRKPVNLFTGAVTYQNVKQGRHTSTMFLDPNTFERFGRPSHVAVVVDIGGQPAGGKANPEVATEWWKSEAPQPIPLLRRDETPWRFLEIEANNTIKP